MGRSKTTPGTRPTTTPGTISRVLTEQAEPMEEDSTPQDIRAEFNAPFAILNDDEGKCYLRLTKKPISCPRHLDWLLFEELGVDKKVDEYLGYLGLVNYAHMDNLVGYEPLCFEFFSTLEFDEKMKFFTCRMFGREFKITLKLMKDVFGFPLTGTRSRPKNFKLKEAWHDLSGCDNWNPSGVSSSLIKDHALAFTHKFLAYNIFGKDQGNKVNANEVFLLSSAKRKDKVCPIYFIWTQLDLIKRRSAFHVSLTPIITCLAAHFQLIPGGVDFVPGQTVKFYRTIDDKELMRGNFIKDRCTIVPHHKRHCVIEYANAQVAASNAQGAGPSSRTDEDEDEEEEEEAAEPTVSPELALTYPDTPLTQHHFDTSMSAFQTHFDNVIGDFRRVLLERLDTQDQRISALETSWDSWTQHYPHPPPAGHQ